MNPATSRAKPEIWQKWSEFEGYAKSLETKATQLAATARTGNAQSDRRRGHGSRKDDVRRLP